MGNKGWTDDARGPSTHVVPIAGSTYDLGSAERPFRNIYANTSVVDSEVLDNNAFLKSADNAGSGTLNLLRATTGDATQMNTKTGTAGGFAVNGTNIGTYDSNSIDFPKFNLTDGSDKNYSLAVYAAGTAYALTNTSALLDFGTTDPTLVLDKGGTYLLFGRVSLKYNGATFAASRTVTLKLRRTNNTAADVSNSTITLATDITTTITAEFQVATLPPVIYQTTTSGTSITDSLSLFGDVSTVPSAGSLDAIEASIVAVRLYT